jgi:nitrile hydratase
MNGVHDMGGMHGMGALEIEREAPVFHAGWEGRVHAMSLAMGMWRRWNIDASRHQRELIPGPEYLRMRYYERWLSSLIELIARSGLATRAELGSGRADPGAPKQTPPLRAEQVAKLVAYAGKSARDLARGPQFAPGDEVRVRNFHPTGHTRAPRYVRGHRGLIVRYHGGHILPDSHAHGLGENPEPLYNVRFAARELWGECARVSDSVHLDLWESYLEPI